MAINKETHNHVSVIMPKELHESIKELATKERRTVSAEICVLVEEAIKKEKEASK